MSVINISNTPEGFERYKLARQRLRDEVMHRREQQWKVFSWASTILLGAFAGVVALTEKGFQFRVVHQFVLGGAIIALAAFSSLRIRHDAGVAKAHSNEAARLDQIFDMDFDDRKHKRKHIGHIGFIWLLTAGVIFMICYAPRISYPQSTPPSNNGMHPTADTKALK
jgi:hypothetical protein